jgi:hypothetical protein
MPAGLLRNQPGNYLESEMNLTLVKGMGRWTNGQPLRKR